MRSEGAPVGARQRPEMVPTECGGRGQTQTVSIHPDQKLNTKQIEIEHSNE